MKISNAISKIRKFYHADVTVPMWLAGAPGIGKSDAVRQARKHIAEDLEIDIEDMGLIDFRASLRDPTDLVGFPEIRNGVTHFAQPSFLPKEETHPEHGILFLDELAQASPMVQAACLQLCLDRKIGEYEVPAGWQIIAASNRREDKAGANRIITPLIDRFAYYEVEADLEGWQDWAAENGVDSMVRSFLNFKPASFSTFDPSGNELVFATPRSWAMLSKVLPALDDDDRVETATGIIGKGTASEFEAFYRCSSHLPDLKKVAKDPENYPVPVGEPSVMYALCGAMGEAASQASGKSSKIGEAMVVYAQRFPEEFQLLAMRDLIRADRKLINMAEAQEWVSKNSGVLDAIAKRNKKTKSRR